MPPIINSPKTLIVITTANHWRFTQATIASIVRSIDSKDIKVMVIDDASQDKTVQSCREMGIACLTKARPLGLTDSWNRAYQLFKANNYGYLFLSNNDLLMPVGSLDILLKGLSHHTLVGPMTNPTGVIQNTNRYKNQQLNEGIVADPDNSEIYQLAQDTLNASRSVPEYVNVDWVNGFIVGMSRSVIIHERRDGNLFDPKLVNIGSEDDLCRRIPRAQKAICKKAFVYHHKGISAPLTLKESWLPRDWHRQLTWDRRQRYGQHWLKNRCLDLENIAWILRVAVSL